MNKQVLSMAALAAMMFGGMPQAQASAHNPTKMEAVPVKIIQREKLKAPLPFITTTSVIDGVPPKVWGQYLQRTGKQVWTKKKNRK